MVKRSNSSKAYVTFSGGTEAEQQKVQEALDVEYNSETMIGYIDATMHWRGTRWQLLSATNHPTAVGVGGNIPPVPPPNDCAIEVLEVLREAGIEVEKG